jgi:hypothetical protein
MHFVESPNGLGEILESEPDWQHWLRKELGTARWTGNRPSPNNRGGFGRLHFLRHSTSNIVSTENRERRRSSKPSSTRSLPSAMMRAPNGLRLREELAAETENILVQRAVGCINFSVVFF